MTDAFLLLLLGGIAFAGGLLTESREGLLLPLLPLLPMLPILKRRTLLLLGGLEIRGLPKAGRVGLSLSLPLLPMLLILLRRLMLPALSMLLLLLGGEVVSTEDFATAMLLGHLGELLDASKGLAFLLRLELLRSEVAAERSDCFLPAVAEAVVLAVKAGDRMDCFLPPLRGEGEDEGEDEGDCEPGEKTDCFLPPEAAVAVDAGGTTDCF